MQFNSLLFVSFRTNRTTYDLCWTKGNCLQLGWEHDKDSDTYHIPLTKLSFEKKHNSNDIASIQVSIS